MSRTRGLDGVEFGLGINRELEFVHGAQFAGVANFVSGTVIGLQLAAGANFSGTGGEEGTTPGEFRGAQLALGYNQALGGGTGLQWAAANFARGELRGLQLGSTNIAQDVRGAQIGFANVATGSVEGLQFGLINYARKSTASLGFFSLIQSEPIRPTFSLDSTPLGFFGVRHGSRFIQNILGFSTGGTPDTKLAGFTYGVGSQFGRRVFVNVDLIYTALWAEAAATSNSGAGAFGYAFGGHRLAPRLSVGWQIAPRFAVFGGASQSLFFTSHDSALGLAPTRTTPVSVGTSGNLYVYPDFHLGIRI
jgi:hypothetical protein